MPFRSLVGVALQRLFEGVFGQYWIEGLIILGWVALWRPMEIFLYEWWPILRERNLYRHLATAEVVVRSSSLRTSARLTRRKRPSRPSGSRSKRHGFVGRAAMTKHAAASG